MFKVHTFVSLSVALVSFECYSEVRQLKVTFLVVGVLFFFVVVFSLSIIAGGGVVVVGSAVVVVHVVFVFKLCRSGQGIILDLRRALNVYWVPTVHGRFR